MGPHGQIELKKEYCNINEIIDDVVHSSELRIFNMQGKIEINRLAQNSSVLADRHHITNLFNNIVDNAIKYKSLFDEKNNLAQEKSQLENAQLNMTTQKLESQLNAYTSSNIYPPIPDTIARCIF
jgi:light-regulated signal transduction histidine kinase (bacteriophytochrome)